MYPLFNRSLIKNFINNVYIPHHVLNYFNIPQTPENKTNMIEIYYDTEKWKEAFNKNDFNTIINNNDFKKKYIIEQIMKKLIYIINNKI